MKQISALLQLVAIIGACLPFFADSFVIPNGKKHISIPSRSVSASARSGSKDKLVRRFLSEENNDDDEKTAPISPPTPPISEAASNEDEEVKKDLSPPSEETVEAERPRVPVPDLPKPPLPLMPKQQQQQVEKPTQPSRSLTADEQRLAVASGVGGFFVGAMFGVFVDLEIPNIDLTMSPILPPVYGAVFLSTFCSVLGGSEGGLGTAVRTTFGGPTVFIGNAFTSIIKSLLNSAVTSAQNKVKETTDDIKAIPGKIADEIKATPGRVAEAAVETATEIADEIKATPGRVAGAAVETATEIADEIKATPGKVADAAVETATEIADEIRATPGRVVKQTKQAVEDVVDDTLDAVEDFVDDVKTIPQKAINNVESALGVSKPSNPRPPLAPPSATKKKTPIPPKDLPGSISKGKQKQSLIPNITSLKIPEPPKLSAPKIDIPKQSASTQKQDAASRKQTPVQYSFPSEAPTSKSEVSKFAFPKFGSNQAKKIPSPEAKADTRVLDAASRRKKDSEAKVEANRLRQEQMKKKQMEAAEKAEEIKRQKQQAKVAAGAAAERKRIQEQERREKIEAQRIEKAEAAAERKRIQEQQKQEKVEAQRIERIEKAEELRRQKQLDAEQKAAKASQQAAERRLIEEEKRQQRMEAQRQAMEKRREEEQEKKRKEKLFQEKKAAEAKKLQEEKEAATQRAQRKQVAAKSLGQAKSRTTISLGNLFGSNTAKDEDEVKLDIATSKPKAVAPPGVPIISQWKQNPDGSISGRISDSPNFSDGQFITSSPVALGAKSYTVVKTSSGSSYFLEQEKQSKGFGFAFSIPRSKKEEGSTVPLEDRSSSSTVFGAKRKVIEDKTAAAAALAEERKAANRKAFEDNKAAAIAAAEEKKARATAAAEEKRAKAAEQRRAVAEAKRQATEEKRAKAAEQQRAAAEAKRRIAEEKKARAAEQRRVAAETKKRAAEKKKFEARRVAEERKIAVDKKTERKISSPQVSAPKVELPPKGVPVIKSWKKRPDGGVSGRIYGSPNFEDGDFIETSPISKGKIENGSTVSTKSRSRYFLSADTAVKKSNIMAAFKDLAGAKPGATITLTKERKEREAKVAIEAIEKAKPRSTFSLFGLGLGDLDNSSSPKEPIKGVPNKNARKNSSASRVRVAPSGVPTMSRWKLNRDGSVTGIISGSVDFNEGERVTTSMVANGRIESGEVVTTGSGSRYFLE